MRPPEMQSERITMVRIQVDIPPELAAKLDQLKLLRGVPKKRAVARALEDVFRRGGKVLL